MLSILCGIAAGNVMRGLGSITHDAAHGTVADTRWGAYLVGWVSWLPSFMSFTIYRSYHLDHHKIVNMPHDTDRVQTSRMTRNPTLAMLLRVLIFVVAYPAYWALRVGRHYRVLSPGLKRLAWLELLVAYAVLGAVLPVMGLQAWLTFFLTMVLTGFSLASLTTMAEHFDVDYHPDPAYSSRTYATQSRIVDWLWGSSTYHVEHHGYPGIPYYNLRRFHREAWPHYPDAVRAHVHPELWATLFRLLRRLATLTIAEEQERARRDEAQLAALDSLDGLTSRRGLGVL